MSRLISNDKVKAHHFDATKRFVDDLGILKDVYKNIYPSEL